MRALVLSFCAVALAGSPAFAQPAVDAASSAEASVPSTAAHALAHFGGGIDVGVPDGLAVVGIWRPLSQLRLTFGPTYNTSSFGLRLGVTWSPIKFVINPTLTVEAGHYFTGNDTSLLSTWVGKSGVAASTFKDLSYDYANAHLGLEFGASRFVFFLHFGLSWVGLHVHDFQTFIRQQTGDDSIEASDPTVRLTTPSLKLGFIFYLG